MREYIYIIIGVCTVLDLFFSKVYNCQLHDKICETSAASSCHQIIRNTNGHGHKNKQNETRRKRTIVRAAYIEMWRTNLDVLRHTSQDVSIGRCVRIRFRGKKRFQ